MHIIVAIIIIIRLIMYFSNNAGGVGGPSSANNPPAKWFLITFPVFIALSLLFTLGSKSPFNYILFPIGLIFCFPSLIAKITISLGWVKVSYWLGSIALAVHTRDMFGGALFYGWCALQKAKAENKENLQRWLEEKLSSRETVLSSGAMVVQVLLKRTKLTETQVMELLRLLNGCNKRLIPGNISRYTCRFMLAREIPRGDWKKIATAAGQWHGYTLNPIANRILYVYWHKNPDIRKKSYFRNLYTYVLAGCLSFEKYFPAYESTVVIPTLTAKNNETISLEDLKLAEWWLKQHLDSDAQDTNNYWQTYLQSDQHLAWKDRLQQLGSYNVDDSFEKIERSIKDVISYRQGADSLESDSASQEKDKNFKLLHIKLRAVTQRVSSKKLMSGSRELEEWFSIALLAKSLTADTIGHSQTYYILRNPCWNWVVELWNNAGNKPLGFLICSFMSPMASTLGDNEAREFFGGIISDKYK